MLPLSSQCCCHLATICLGFLAPSCCVANLPVTNRCTPMTPHSLLPLLLCCQATTETPPAPSPPTAPSTLPTPSPLLPICQVRHPLLERPRHILFPIIRAYH